MYAKIRLKLLELPFDVFVITDFVFQPTTNGWNRTRSFSDTTPTEHFHGGAEETD